MGPVASLILYAGLGVLLGQVLHRSRRLRESHAFQGFAMLAVVGTGALTLVALDDAEIRGLAGHPPSQAFLFLCAALCHVPVVVWVLLSQWNRLIVYLTSPAGQVPPRRRSARTEREEWKLIESCLQALARNPVHPVHRRRLAEAYLRLGLTDSALGEFRRAIECLDRGYEQSLLLFKTSRILVDRKRDVRAALPLLRRLIRLYPKSWFAAYARRIVNGYEARQHTRDGGG